MWKVVTAIFTVLCVACATLASRDPSEWRIQRPAYDHELVTFYVALHQRNIPELERVALEVSDPRSPRYGKHLTNRQVLDIVAPPKEDHDAVVNWFRDNMPGARIQSFEDALKITAPAASVNRALKTTIYAWQHKKTGIRTLRMFGGFTIPEAVKDKIYMIVGLTTFPFIHRTPKEVYEEGIKNGLFTKREVEQPDGTYNFVYPAGLRKVYNVPPNAAASNPKTNQLALEFLPVGAPLDSDIKKFCTMANEVYTNYSKVWGPWHSGQEDTESTLDVEWIMAMGSKVQNWYYTVKSGWIYEMAVELNALSDVPQVVSISYGWPESDSCDSSVTGAKCKSGETNQQYVQRSNVELAKLAAKGVSVLVASGDTGSWGPTNNNCQNRQHPLNPLFPTSSPWVTSVSATVLVNKKSDEKWFDERDLPQICNEGYQCINGPVVEWPCMVNNTYYRWTTGGGFSEFSPQPSWQKNEVAAYVNSKVMLPPSQYWNKNNRGFPDVSAAGSRILIVMGGYVVVSAGTSASTPIFAGLVSLLNDWRLNNNKPVLGFLNPLLYQMYEKHPQAFTDITLGDNRCTEGFCCPFGYGATKGWDAVTGLGTPNFQEMLNYIKTLPN
jgi:subtilase family serine protease